MNSNEINVEILKYVSWDECDGVSLNADDSNLIYVNGVVYGKLFQYLLCNISLCHWFNLYDGIIVCFPVISFISLCVPIHTWYSTCFDSWETEMFFFSDSDS